MNSPGAGLDERVEVGEGCSCFGYCMNCPGAGLDEVSQVVVRQFPG